METEYKYYRTAPVNTPDAWRLRKPEQERMYDLVLIDIIDNGMRLSNACRKHQVNKKSFYTIARQQRALGVVFPASNGWKPNKYEPNGIYKYWVPPYNCVEKQTVEYGKMMDVAIQMFLDGSSHKQISELFGLSPAQFNISVSRCRRAGSPIPHTPARKNGNLPESDPDIFEFVNGQNKVKPSIVQEWVHKRLQGYTQVWIANEYRVAQATVSRLIMPFMPKNS